MTKFNCLVAFKLHTARSPLPHIKLFKKIKRSPELVFCIIFEEKYFPCYIVLNDQI